MSKISLEARPEAYVSACLPPARTVARPGLDIKAHIQAVAEHGFGGQSVADQAEQRLRNIEMDRQAASQSVEMVPGIPVL